MTQGYQLDHSISLRLLKHFFDNDLLEYCGLPLVLPLPLAVLPLTFKGQPRSESKFLFFPCYI